MSTRNPQLGRSGAVKYEITMASGTSTTTRLGSDIRRGVLR
jgi:hypothetical protein